MFTGLVAGLGRLARPRPCGAGLTITVEHALAGAPVASGESINVDGCCLTAAAPAAGRFDADLSPETLSRTGGRLRWRAGREVHLERALAAGDRMGGHVVQGHAAGLLRIQSVRHEAGGWLTLRLELPADARPLAVPKGSVALDGVSLTVSRRGAAWFEVALIPATLSATTLGRRRAGERMIVEWDVLARVALEASKKM
jgi:riboflavin synthase